MFHKLQLHLAYRYIFICVFIRHTFYVSLVKIYATKHHPLSNAINIYDIFFRQIKDSVADQPKQTVSLSKNSVFLLRLNFYISKLFVSLIDICINIFFLSKQLIRFILRAIKFFSNMFFCFYKIKENIFGIDFSPHNNK